MDGAAVVVHEDGAPLRIVLEAEHAGAAADEVPRVVKGVEADDVGVEEAAQELLALGERAEDLGRGEGAVKEDADRHLQRKARR